MTATDDPVPLTPQEVAALLRASATTLTAELSSLPEPALRWHPVPGEWCAKEALGHLIEAERRGFAGRVRAVLAVDEPAFSAWDMGAVARERHDCERDMAELLAEFDRLRAASVTLVAGLRAGDLSRGGTHPAVGHLTVADLLHEWVHHDRNHIRQILAAAQSYVWPHLGNAQRFSAP